MDVSDDTAIYRSLLSLPDEAHCQVRNNRHAGHKRDGVCGTPFCDIHSAILPPREAPRPCGYTGRMSEGPKINRAVLLGELFACGVWAAMMTLRGLGLPPRVREATNVPLYVIVCVSLFALVIGLFNLSYLAGRNGRRGRGLFLLTCAVLLIPFLLLISLAQY